MADVVGYIDYKVVSLLNLSIAPGTPILMGESNLQHMQSSHPEDFAKYFDQLNDILTNPDYINKNPQDGSIKYIKRLEEHVVVGVRISAKGSVFARTIFVFQEHKIQQYMAKGYLIPYK